mgnify:FL=1
MSFNYIYKNNEANFGKPLRKQIKGGMHITIEIILKKGNKFIALRRDSIPGHEAPPKKRKCLFFCHDLIRYGEDIEDAVKRIVKRQAGVSVEDCKVVYIDSSVQSKDDQWAITPHVIAELKAIPKTGFSGNKIYEVVLFNKKDVPKDFAWWPRKDLREFLEEFA